MHDPIAVSGRVISFTLPLNVGESNIFGRFFSNKLIPLLSKNAVN